jgi:aminoglycoside 2'-N-acetyltransferase I
MKDNSIDVRRVSTNDLTEDEVQIIRRLLVDAFGPDPEDAFTEEDWQHAIGGMHFVAAASRTIVSHASVVPRTLEVDGRPLRTGYVEAVATAAPHRRKGYGTAVMRVVGEYIRERFELGALGTGSHGFYERLGWETWRGPSSVRTQTGLQRTSGEDGYIMVLRTSRSPLLDFHAAISCEWRAGDVW